MRVLALAVMLSLALPLIAKAGEMTVNTLLNLYDIPESTSPAGNAVAGMAFRGIEMGLLTANASLVSTRKEHPLYCQPQQLALTLDQIVDILRRQVKQAPPLGDMDAGTVMLIAFQQTFPCDKNSNLDLPHD